jgi:hypothetical protein
MGKLNLLHHKDWHVYLKVNRDKVIEDEKKFALEAKAQEDKILKAEQEARLSKLRLKAKTSLAPINNKRKEKERLESTAFRLFEEEEKYKNSESVASDKQLAQKAHEDKHTWFLGETRDGKKDPPWYVTENFGRSTDIREPKKKKRKQLDEQHKILEDPMTKVGKYSTSSLKIQKCKPESKPKTMEELRKQRLEREIKERSRTHDMLYPNQKKIHETDAKFYNSQFNPKLVNKRN